MQNSSRIETRNSRIAVDSLIRCNLYFGGNISWHRNKTCGPVSSIRSSTICSFLQKEYIKILRMTFQFVCNLQYQLKLQTPPSLQTSVHGQEWRDIKALKTIVRKKSWCVGVRPDCVPLIFDSSSTALVSPYKWWLVTALPRAKWEEGEIFPVRGRRTLDFYRFCVVVT